MEPSQKSQLYYVFILLQRIIQLDIGFAVYHAEHKTSSKGYQEADQVILRRLTRFLKTDTDDAEGVMTWGGDDDLNAYFYDKAFNMFMRELQKLGQISP